jgi:hypothetical protein
MTGSGEGKSGSGSGGETATAGYGTRRHIRHGGLFVGYTKRTGTFQYGSGRFELGTQMRTCGLK